MFVNKTLTRLIRLSLKVIHYVDCDSAVSLSVASMFTNKWTDTLADYTQDGQPRRIPKVIANCRSIHHAHICAMHSLLHCKDEFARVSVIKTMSTVSFEAKHVLPHMYHCS